MLNQITLLNFENQIIRFVGDNVVANDVALVLGYADPATIISKIINKDYKTTITLPTKGGRQSVVILTSDGVKQLLVKSQMSSDKKKKLAEFSGIDLTLVSSVRKETELIKTIQLAFAHIPSVAQFAVEEYKIDLYFPKNLVAVECDEGDHKGYDFCKEVERQIRIKEILGCEFVRFNPDLPDFNIGVVINKILLLLKNENKK